jgi:hypothetical protein
VAYLACAWVVAADAAPAHRAHVAAAMAVTESSRIAPLLMRARTALVDSARLVAATCGWLVLMRDSS